MRQLVDDSSTPLVPAGLSFSPFGLPQSGALPAPFGFTGELHHGGLQYLRARWYDPGEGTFTSEDPFAGFERMPYSLHPYQYGYSAPTLYVDPSGQCTAEYGKVIPCQLPPNPPPTPLPPTPEPTWIPPAPATNGEIGQPSHANALLAVGSFTATKPHPIFIAAGTCAFILGAVLHHAFRDTQGITTDVRTDTYQQPVGLQGPTSNPTLQVPPVSLGEETRPQPTAAPTAIPTPTATPGPRINLDTGAAINLIVVPTTTADANVQASMAAFLQGYELVMTTTAITEFWSILSSTDNQGNARAGTAEQLNAAAFVSRVTQVPDNPSVRAQALRPTNNLGANDIIIFGTGDQLGIITVTVDRRAVQALNAQGANFQTRTFPSLRLSGR